MRHLPEPRGKAVSIPLTFTVPQVVVTFTTTWVTGDMGFVVAGLRSGSLAD